jgi:hypothetical protein
MTEFINPFLLIGIIVILFFILFVYLMAKFNVIEDQLATITTVTELSYIKEDMIYSELQNLNTVILTFINDTAPQIIIKYVEEKIANIIYKLEQSGKIDEIKQKLIELKNTIIQYINDNIIPMIPGAIEAIKQWIQDYIANMAPPARINYR